MLDECSIEIKRLMLGLIGASRQAGRKEFVHSLAVDVLEPGKKTARIAISCATELAPEASGRHYDA
jgi:hypothetical protein